MTLIYFSAFTFLVLHYFADQTPPDTDLEKVETTRHRFPRLITINPPGLLDPKPFAYSQIRLDTLNYVAYIAGQTSVNVNGTVLGSNLAEQLSETEKNIKIALGAVGATVDDIISVNTFIKNFNPETDLKTFMPTGNALGNPVNTLVSVPSLAFEDLLVEIEVRAAVSPFAIRKYRY